MKTIFEPVKLGNLNLKNRIVRSATFENGAIDGILTPVFSKLYEDLADGGVDLIITGMMGVGANSCATSTMPKIYADNFVSGFSAIAEAVHRKGSKIVVQLSHCGYKATVIENGTSPQAPSETGTAKEMSKEDIRKLIHDFGVAALTCKEAGADGVQIHGAHGYLVSQLLSPFCNKRTDEYGTTIEGRAKVLFEIYDEIRLKVGNQYPVLVKINYSDLIDGGLTGDESVWVCKELEKRGIDAIEVSAGIAVGLKSSPVKMGAIDEGYFSDFALKVSSEITTPVISVGGYRTPEGIEKYLNKGNIAAISMSRPFVKEPALLARWKRGDRSKSQCISCNRCFSVKPIRCLTNE